MSSSLASQHYKDYRFPTSGGVTLSERPLTPEMRSHSRIQDMRSPPLILQ
ncbi:MAG: hypothetical protein RIG27_33260 [Coleofasciculus sp. F4-SAH-05]